MSNQKKKKSKHSKLKFIAAFCVAMVLFAAIRHGFSISIPHQNANNDSIAANKDTVINEEIPVTDKTTPVTNKVLVKDQIPTSQRQNNGHKVMGVYSWDACFPDSQNVQIQAAIKNGVTPCKTRKDAQLMVDQHKLVNITNSPFYIVDDLSHSMPYLVPKAQHLLNTICLNFIDSLQIKGVPLHLPMITSAFRTIDDVSTLQIGNKNATTNSCHCYGTTVDITYNRFMPLTGHYDPKAELTRWDLPMKQVMAEVLRDLREQGLCYVKYEKKQGCFHLTVR